MTVTPCLGKMLVAVGAIFVAAGVYLILGGKLDWLGRLPGDIALKREGFSFHFPITTCLLVSAVISLLLWFLRK